MDIVDQIRTNREEGARRLASEYKARLLAVACRFCSDPTEAESLAWRTMDEAVRSIETLSNPDSLFSWMCGIMSNWYGMAVRRKIDGKIVYTDHLPEISDESSGIDQIVESVDGEALHKAIAALPPKLREAILLRYFMDLPLLKIAKILAVPVSTVGSRLRLAKKALAARLCDGVKKPAVIIAAACLALFSVAATVAVFTTSLSTPPAETAAAVEAVEDSTTASTAAAGTVGAGGAGNAGGGAEEDVAGVTGEMSSAASPAADTGTPDALAAENTESQKGEQAMNVMKATTMATAAVALATSPLSVTAGDNDGYIESEGDAFVSLGHCVGPNTKIEVDFQLTEVALDTKPFGSWGDRATIPMFSLYISHMGDNVPRFSWDSTDADGNRQALNCDVANLNRHVISYDVPSRTYASTDVTGEESPYTYTFPNPFPDHTSPYPLAVFGRGSDSPATQASHFGGATKMKVYGVRIYESGALLKTYVPCLKGGVPGLKVSGTGIETFVTGIDPAKVKYGGDILVESGDPCISTEINDVYTGLAPGERVYLDTGYLFKTYSRVELDFAPLTPNDWTSDTKYNHAPEFMYARSYNPTYELEIVGRNGSTGNIGVRIGNADYRDVLPLNVAYGIRRTISVDSNSVSMATAGYTNYANKVTAAGYGILADLETTIKLGSAYGTGNDFAPMKIYGLKIFESGELVKDFRPAVTNGVPGMIDVKNPEDVRFASTCAGGMRTNLVFEAYGGFDCADGSDEAYLEFPGTSEQRIDTGLVVTNDSCVEADFALWNTGNIGGVQQVPLVQDAGDGFLVYLYINSEQNFGYQYADYVSGVGFVNTRIRADNSRKRFKFDGPNRRMSIVRGEETLYDEPMTGEYARSGGSGTLKFASSSARMRLYGFRVTTAGEVVRDYVPCMSEGQAGLYELCTKTFTPVEGAKVRGAKSRNAEGVPVAFQVPPKDAKVTKKENDVPTFTCLASGAQSYEWYADGALVEGATNDTLTVNWKKLKKPFTVEYSVVPVYTVFNETVKGAAATAVVTMPPKGTALFFK